MSLDGDYTKSVDKSSGDALLNGMWTVKEFVKAIEARQAVDDAMRTKRTFAAYQDLHMINNEQWMHLHEFYTCIGRRMNQNSDQYHILSAQERRMDKQRRRMSSQTCRLSKLEQQVSKITAEKIAPESYGTTCGKTIEKTAESMPGEVFPQYAEVPEETNKPICEKTLKKNSEESSPSCATAKSRRGGGRCRIN